MPGNITALLGERMGSACGKLRKKAPWTRQRRAERNAQANAEAQEEEDENLRAARDAEKERLNSLRKLIRESPHVFLLDNLLMCIQFFADYEKEIKKAREKVRLQEAKLNTNLLPEKVALIPDVLTGHFAGKVRFMSFLKSDRDEQTVEPLKPIQIYIVYENVVVTEVEDSHYSTPDKLILNYNFVLKQAVEKEKIRDDKEDNVLPGYVRLQKKNGRAGVGSNSDLSSIAENTDEIYSEDGSVYGPINKNRLNGNGTASSLPNLVDEEIYCDQKSGSAQDLLKNSNNGAIPNGRSPTRISRYQGNLTLCSANALRLNHSAPSSSSGYKTSCGVDSDSDSSALSSARCLTRREIRPWEIPGRCFKSIEYDDRGRIYSPRKKQNQLSTREQQILDAKKAGNYKIIYVSSDEFAKHFYKLFKRQLAEKLDFDNKTVKLARKIDATIKLEKISYLSETKYTSIEQYEVIPCLSSPWPSWAQRWEERARGDWPTADDLRRLKKLSCYLVPESLRLVDPRQNVLWRFDWNLSYPAAERHLETCLSASQITVYTIALVLHKTFFRSLSSNFGLDTSHIRNMIFWMVEKQPRWSDHEMGKHMLKLLQELHDHIQRRRMDDYFLQERNLFNNVHIDSLLHSQKQLKRIIENPVMFVFHAMEKIHYETEDFERLDYQELLRLLTINELVLINPNLEVKAQEAPKPVTGYGKREAEKDFWRDVKEANQHYMQTRKRSTKTLINPKQMMDSIVNIREKCEPLTSTRLSELLIFFGEHFLKMARSCHKLAAKQQKTVYLERARLLALLLADEPRYARRSGLLLANVRELCDDSVPQPAAPSTPVGAPQTPRRNPTDGPIFADSLNRRFRFAEAQVTVHEAGEAELPTRSALHANPLRTVKTLTIQEEAAAETTVETTDF